MAAAAGAESVERDLPDTASPDEAITVGLTQEGFLANVVEVIEYLPEGFAYMTGSFTGSYTPTYHPGNNTLVMYLAGEDEITATYRVTTGTVAQIQNAMFIGAYQGWEANGVVTGEDTLTPVEPTPPPYDLNGDEMITPVDALIALEMASGSG